MGSQKPLTGPAKILLYIDAFIVGFLTFLANATWAYTFIGPLHKAFEDNPKSKKEFLKWFPWYIFGWLLLALLLYQDLPAVLQNMRVLAFMIIGFSVFLAAGMAFDRVPGVTTTFFKAFREPFVNTAKEVRRILERGYPPESPKE